MAYFPLPESWFPDFGKALDAKPLMPGQLLGYPWKVGYDGLNELCGRSLASKLSAQRFNTFLASLHGNWWKGDFLEECSVAENFYYENLLGLVPTDSLNALFRSASTSCRTFDFPVHPSRPAPIFPEFIDEL